MKSKAALIAGGFKARASKLRSVIPTAAVMAATVAVAAAQDTTVVEAELTAQIVKIGLLATAGLGVTAAFVGWSITRRGVKKLGGS